METVRELLRLRDHPLMRVRRRNQVLVSVAMSTELEDLLLSVCQAIREKTGVEIRKTTLMKLATVYVLLRLREKLGLPSPP